MSVVRDVNNKGRAIKGISNFVINILSPPPPHWQFFKSYPSFLGEFRPFATDDVFYELIAPYAKQSKISQN